MINEYIKNRSLRNTAKSFNCSRGIIAKFLRKNDIQINPKYGRSKNWIVISPDNERKQILNLNNFCKENNLSTSLMILTAHGLRKHHKKWGCELIEEKN